MRHEHAARALVKLMQIGQTSSGTDPIFHHAPEAFDGMKVVSAPGGESRQAKLLVPVYERGCERVCPVDATAVHDHHDLFPGMAQERHHLMDILAQPLGIQLGNDLIEDFGGALWASAANAAPHPTGHTAPTPIGPPRLTLERLFACDLAGTEGPGGEAKTLGGAAPPARPRERKTPDHGCIFIQQNHLAPLGAGLQSGQFARRPRQVSRVGSEASCGAAVAAVFFFRRCGHSHG
jgi:hypothetical protein